ncbi:MAG TPA: hypothetical protein PK364_01645, partial [Synergistaceae bacterium]|nr:hypothetical protein [Synergistaceae bacterium]
NQETLSTQVGKTAKIIDRAYADLTGVSIAQDTLQATFAGQSDKVNDRMTRMEANQKSLGRRWPISLQDCQIDSAQRSGQFFGIMSDSRYPPETQDNLR